MARVIRAGASRVPQAQVEALDDATRIRRVAEADADQVRAKARQEGLEAGRAEVALQLIETARQRVKVLHDAEAALVPLVRSVVERLLQATFDAEPTRIADLVRSHLVRLERAEDVELHLHPDDARALDNFVIDAPAFRVLHDPSMQRGDLLVVSSLGRIDARISLQLDALVKALTKHD